MATVNWIGGSGTGGTSVSEDFDSTSWGFEGGMSVVKNGVANPINGALTADTITWTGPYATFKQNNGLTVVAGEKICFSIYARKATWSCNFKFYLLSTGYVTIQDVSFDVNGSTGAFTAVDAYSRVVDLGNGWLRISGGMTIASAGTYLPYCGMMSLGAQSVDVWGAMLEKGSLLPTRYQPDNALGATGPTTTLNPANKSSFATLADDNRTFSNGFSANASAVAIASVSSGLIYFEAEIHSTGYSGNNWCVGIGNSSYALAVDPYNSANAIGLYRSYAAGNAQAGTGGSSLIALAAAGARGDVVGVCFNPTTKKAWFRLNAGLWNNSGTADPVSGVGGVAWTFSGPYFPVIACDDTNEVATMRFAPASWGFTPPTGATSITGALWTPANLTTRPVAEFNADDVPWSGTAFADCANTGTMGGTWGIGTTATPAKGSAPVNGHLPAVFSGGQGLRTSLTANLPAGTSKQVFAVVKGLSDTHGALIGQNWGVNFGDVWYVRDGGHMVAYSGTPSGLSQYQSGGDPGAGLAALTVRFSTDGYALPHQMRINGVADLSFVSNPTYAIASDTDDFWLGESGNHFGNEFLNGQVLYAMESVGLPDTEVQKLEGWASWYYAGDGSLLPVGHPYKSAPPTISAGGTTYSVSLAETATALESSVSVLALAAASSEVATAIHAQTSSAAFGSAATEAATAIHAQTATETRVGATTEAATVTQAQTNTWSGASATTEAATATDSSTGPLTRVGALSEPAAATDASASGMAAGASATELAAQADTSVSSTANGGVDAIELAAQLDSSATQLAAVAAASEPAVAVDAQASVLTALAAATEAATATHAQTSAAAFGSARIEAATGLDASTTAMAAGAAATETALVLDFSDWGGGTIYPASAIEAATAVDAVAAFMAAVASIAELAGATETVAGGLQAVAASTEAANATDAASAVRSLTAAQTVTATLVELSASSQAALAIVLEAVAGNDVLTNVMVMAVALVEASPVFGVQTGTIAGQVVAYTSTAALLLLL
ncbi:hypothetical protein GCM10007036_14420 [Alsobacter metallidurans]|uniref:B30.2/SPRY domain-containing protein n=1 Tax=Alsobacter metallidurans TaxID=340221 RepID=A0A917I644_9HYPH|nr:hypothetical protein [Alsobacter metallidurans]GGH14845.1 hypothetical protein GCM10007036_14420 [Alsobacter metallidurans]